MADLKQKYDAPTVAVMRQALNEVVTDRRFLVRKSVTPLEVAEHIVQQAASGERDLYRLKSSAFEKYRCLRRWYERHPLMKAVNVGFQGERILHRAIVEKFVRRAYGELVPLTRIDATDRRNPNPRGHRLYRAVRFRHALGIWP
jgi:hypothetical protein